MSALHAITTDRATQDTDVPVKLCDPQLERMFVAALIADPDSFATCHVAARDLADPHAMRAMEALANVRHAGLPITAQNIRKRLQDDYTAKAEPRAGEELADLAWFDKIASAPIVKSPPIAGWAHSILGFTAKRQAAIAAAEPVVEISIERGPAAPESTPWEKALATAYADIRKHLGAQAATQRGPIFSFETTDACDLLEREFTATTWLVDGLITRGGITTFGGEPKSTKTWLALEVAIAIATGTKVCGEFSAAPGVVGYFFAEDHDRQVRNRVRALLAGRGSKLARNRLHTRGRGMFIDITKDDELAWVIASARSIGKLDLLVLDPLRDISSAAEDKSDEMSPVMRRLRLVGELLGCTVAIVHHTGKASLDTKGRRPGQRLRGSGAIHGSTDSGVYLSDTKGDGRAEFVNTVDPEVKGARSAGRFTLSLSVTDDDQGEAVRATWTVSRDGTGAGPVQPIDDSPGPERDAADDRKVLQRVTELHRKGERRSMRQLRNGCGIPERRGRASLTRLLAADLITLRDIDDKGWEVVCLVTT